LGQYPRTPKNGISDSVSSHERLLDAGDVDQEQACTREIDKKKTIDRREVTTEASGALGAAAEF
jgi:hypothetical protein